MEIINGYRRISVAEQGKGKASAVKEEEDRKDAEVDAKVDKFYALIRSYREARNRLRTESEQSSTSERKRKRKKIKVTDGGVRARGGSESSSISIPEDYSNVIRRRMDDWQNKIGQLEVDREVECRRLTRTVTCFLLPCAGANQSNGHNQVLDRSCLLPKDDDDLDLKLHL